MGEAREEGIPGVFRPKRNDERNAVPVLLVGGGSAGMHRPPSPHALLLGWQSAVSLRCRAAVPTGGRRSKPSPRFFVVRSTRFARLRYPRISNGGRNKRQRTSGSLPAISGESVKGGYPLSPSERGESRAQTPERKRLGSGLPRPQLLLTRQSTTTNRNSPPRASGAQGSFDWLARSAGRFGRGAHLQTPLRRIPARMRRPPSGPLDLAEARKRPAPGARGRAFVRLPGSRQERRRRPQRRWLAGPSPPDPSAPRAGAALPPDLSRSGP